MVPSPPGWPPHRQEPRPWTQAHRGGTRADHTLGSINVSLPPHIADLIDGDDVAAFGTLLLRTESVASSKIEQIEASIDDYARAVHGSRSNPSAVSMVAATAALEAMIGNDPTESGEAGRRRAF